MNGYNFTERVRRAMMRAREEAMALGHEYVGTEHILLGLCAKEDHVGEGVATAALHELGVDIADLRESVLKLVRPGQPGAVHGPDLPYTSRAKRSLELAMSEARRLRHSYVGSEHVLLGLVAEERGIAAQVLASRGVTLPGLEQVVLALLGTESPGPASPQGAAPRAQESVPMTITMVVEHGDGRIEARKFRTVWEAAQFLTTLDG